MKELLSHWGTLENESVFHKLITCLHDIRVAKTSSEDVNEDKGNENSNTVHTRPNSSQTSRIPDNTNLAFTPLF